MKSQLRCILFALLAVPACSGSQQSSTVSSEPAPVVAPVARVPEAPAASPAAPVPPAPVAAVAVAPSSYGEALALGKAKAAAGDLPGARDLLEAAAKLDRKAAEPHIELTRVFVAMGARGRAVSAAHKAVKLAPASSAAFNALGRAELARFNYDNAIAAFRKSTELAPDNIWAWNNLGFTYLQLEHYEEAVEPLVEATSRKGAESYMWNNLGTAYEHLDQLDDARAAFEAGGKLGSKEAVASRKRLQGVKTIAMAGVPPAVKVEAAAEAAGAETDDVGVEQAPPVPEPEPAEPSDAADDAGDPPVEKAAPAPL